MTLPDFSFEKKLWRQGHKYIVGLDEVGRGAWAGPVVVGAVVFAPTAESLKLNAKRLGIKINDSKKLTSRQREVAEKWIRENSVAVSVAAISAKRIDVAGISKATHSGFRRVVASIQKRLSGKVKFVLIDAFYIPYLRGFPIGLKKGKKRLNFPNDEAPTNLRSGYLLRSLRRERNPAEAENSSHSSLRLRSGFSAKADKIRQLAIINGDQKSATIAAASIVAKVHRDKLMISLSRKYKYKKYLWGQNKGYGTRAHQEVIKKYGTTGYHRRTFLGKLT